MNFSGKIDSFKIARWLFLREEKRPTRKPDGSQVQIAIVVIVLLMIIITQRNKFQKLILSSDHESLYVISVQRVYNLFTIINC